MKNRAEKIGLLVVVAASAFMFTERAHAQGTFDSPIAKKPPVNTLVVINADKTNTIAANCSDGCHAGGAPSWGSGTPGDLWARGETRLQMVRRAMTGGYGVDTSVIAPDGGSANALSRNEGVMDAYKVRWGIAWYDGIGTRLAIDPTTDNDAAQRAMIDFGQPANDWYAYMPQHGYGTQYPGEPGLNSYDQFPFTVWNGCSEAHPYDPWILAQGIPWNGRRQSKAPSRMARALKWAKEYYDPHKNVKQYKPSGQEKPYTTWFSPGPDPNDETVIDGDISNVLNSPGAAGCRRNFVILMSDGGGQGMDGGQCSTCDMDLDGDCRQSITECAPAGPIDCTFCDEDSDGECRVAVEECDMGVGKSPGDVAQDIFNLNHGTLDPGEQTQVFSIHFGDWAPANAVADFGWDGVAGGPLGTTFAFNAAPGGVMNLPPMMAAFGAIFSLVLAGDYNGAAPTLTRAGTSLCAGGAKCDRLAVSDFKIFDCNGISPIRCNLGRPSGLKWVRLDPTTGNYVGGYPGSCTYPDCYDMGSMLRARTFSDRNTYTGYWAGHGNAPTETNCGLTASCSNRTARMRYMAAGTGFPGPLNNEINFVRGDPTTKFIPSVPFAANRGDSNMDMVDDTLNPYKLSNIANSRPVIAGAPPGVGELVDRWMKFRDRTISRSPMNGPDPFPLLKVGSRDQVLYVGANDGFVHAFLVGKAASTPSPGSSATYEMIGASCADANYPVLSQTTYGVGTLCDGQEIWAYSPRMVQPNWQSLRAGHYYMVDGTPVVEDVLFTKGSANPGPVCGTAPACGLNDWEYRTVLVQCLGAGGGGCFAMDVTNPWNPNILWERQFTGITGKGTSTSQPVIARVKKLVAGKVIPYYVALFGGGHNEAGASGNKGTFIAVGIEDGAVFTSAACNPVTDPGCADFSGPPTCTDTDNDSYTDTCYIASTVASVYKVRINGGNPASGIVMSELFRGRHSTAGNNANLRAFTRVIATSDIDNKLNLVFGTGDLDDPSSSTETNYLFKFRDLDPKQAPVPWTFADNTARQTNACSSAPGSLSLPNPLNPGSFRLAPGEKILFNPALVGGSVMFTSYQPQPNPCLIGGGALYGIRHDTCANGVDTNGDAAPDTDRVSLGVQLPGEVSINYGKGTVYVANTAQKDAVAVNPGKPPPPARFRVNKLNWRRQ